MSPMLYATLALAGHYSMEDLMSFRQWGSCTPGHPERDVARGVENTSGPLGQGHTMAIGSAMVERIIADRFGDWSSHKTVSFISDGGIQEEISQGAGRIAGFLGLSNLILYYDSNQIQLSTKTESVTRENTAAKYKSWGWTVYEIDGHNQDQIRETLALAYSEKDHPVLIIGSTIMGKGCLKEDGTSFEKQSSTHGQPISKAGASFVKTVENLGGQPDQPFAIFDDVAKHYFDSMQNQLEKVKHRKEMEKEWRQSHEEGSSKLDHWLDGKLPEIYWEGIVHKENIATRAASGNVLSSLAKELDNLVVMSADLANSDKTDGFLKHTTPFNYQDFKGSFFHAGVSELTMAAIANGMALHGGVIPACGTFFVFSDYMKPAVRMAALLELQVIYIWTHDAFRVGEDGPTHQPVEHEAQLRLMEELKNHSGRSSLLVLRPADSNETTSCWTLAIENKLTPTALILSRQNIKDLPAPEGNTRFEQANEIVNGAYVIKDCSGQPDLILVANGSEVSTLFDTAVMLEEKKDLKVSVVSAPSPSLFEQMPIKYQRNVFPAGVPIFGLTAGLPSALKVFSGENNNIIGLDHFGYSAPAEVLDEKFGFVPEVVYNQVFEWLNEMTS